MTLTAETRVHNWRARGLWRSLRWWLPTRVGRLGWAIGPVMVVRR